jgi:hypothetical protein
VGQPVESCVQVLNGYKLPDHSSLTIEKEPVFLTDILIPLSF